MQLEVGRGARDEWSPTAEDIRRKLAASGQVLDAPEGAAGRIHAFDFTIQEIIDSGERRRGQGLEIVYGFHPSPFGDALLMASGGGLCALAFADEGVVAERRAAIEDIKARWPLGRYRERPDETAPIAESVFGAAHDGARSSVPIVLIGTPFDVDVWRTLLRIPLGYLVSYTDIACHLERPTAARAVGTANGRNPISFVVPCHRALRTDGTLGGYYWGLERKRAMIAWEASQA